MRNGKSGQHANGAERAKARAAADAPRPWFRRILPRREHVGHAVIFGGMLAVAYAILLSGKTPLGVTLGRPSPRDYRAKVSFTVQDMDRTRLERQKARESADLVLKETREQFEASRRKLLELAARQTPAEPGDGTAPEVRDADPELRLALRQRRTAIEDVLGRVGEFHLASREDWERSAPDDPGRILLGAETQDKEARPGDIIFLSADEPALIRLFADVLAGLPGRQQHEVLTTVTQVLEPSVMVDVERTRGLGDEAARRVPFVLKHVAAGTLVLAAGTQVTEQHIRELEEEASVYWSSSDGVRVRWQRLVGWAIVLLALAVASGAYIARYRAELVRNRLQSMAFALIALALIALGRLFLVLDVPPLLVPLPMVIMVLCLVYDQRFGFETAAFYGLLVGVVRNMTPSEMIVLMLGAMFTAVLTGRVRTRSTLIKAGCLVGAVQWVATWGLGLLTGDSVELVGMRFWESDLFNPSLCALANGVLSGFLVSGLLPGIEQVFGLTTDIRLLEWSDPNQPLLQRLLVEAPGTYHHSMVVGTLAADAAEAVDANPLLARVSAYFHDVGKLKKPEYFAENIPKEGGNPHDALSPTMSRLIIAAHPRDGADLAEQYGVPGEVRDIILQSHGATTIKYFWDRAKEQSDAGDAPTESAFRYRLPKPGSKEAACVMLCDACESATRSVVNPTPSRLMTIVHEIVMDRLHDGQLDESRLTITDLAKIEKTLARSLGAVHHSRVPYPGQPEAKGSETPRPEPAQPAEQEENDQA